MNRNPLFRNQLGRHSRAGGNPVLKLDFKRRFTAWISACAGMMILIILPCLVHAGIDLGFAREDGGQPGTFLDFSVSARSMAMGQAHAGIADDASNTYTNPAGLAQIQRKDFVTTYASLYENTSFGSFNYAQPSVDWGTFGIGLVSVRSGDFERRDIDGFKAGTFSTSELGVLLSHGINLNDRLSLGSGVKVIREEVDSFAGTGYGFDTSLMMRVNPKFQVGAVLHNLIAPQLTLKKETDRYPRDIRVGTEWQAQKKLLVAFDLNQTAGRSTKIHVGTEWAFNELLALRAGLNETELTTGLGFRFNDFSLDYAFSYQDAVGGLRDLGATHRFGIHMNFGKKISEQGASQKWLSKGQLNLEKLRKQMNSSRAEITVELKAVVEGTKDVIRHQGYPKATDLYAAQGYVSYFEGEYERSVQSLNEALKLEPENTELAAHLENARKHMTEERKAQLIANELKQVRDLYAKGDWKGALQSCETILTYDPNHIEAATFREDAKKQINEPIEREMKIAVLKFERGEYLDAIKSFQRVKEMDPGNRQATNYISHAIAALEKEAMLQNNSEQRDEISRDVYEINRNTDGSRALYSKGLILYSQGKLKEAASAWNRAVESDPENALAKNALNRVQLELKDLP